VVGWIRLAQDRDKCPAVVFVSSRRKNAYLIFSYFEGSRNGKVEKCVM
jgi:hypothetical protein